MQGGTKLIEYGGGELVASAALEETIGGGGAGEGS